MSTKNWQFDMGGPLKDWPQVVCGDGPADLIARTYGTKATEHAQLIAAAPDLLAALERIASRASCAPNDDEEQAGAEFARIMREAQAAIAKARGQT